MKIIVMSPFISGFIGLVVSLICKWDALLMITIWCAVGPTFILLLVTVVYGLIKEDSVHPNLQLISSKNINMLRYYSKKNLP